MTLSTSGAISLAQMHAEFGLGYSFASYRGKGSVPASGTVYFSQMYGASNVSWKSQYNGAAKGGPTTAQYGFVAPTGGSVKNVSGYLARIYITQYLVLVPSSGPMPPTPQYVVVNKWFELANGETATIYSAGQGWWFTQVEWYY